MTRDEFNSISNKYYGENNVEDFGYISEDDMDDIFYVIGGDIKIIKTDLTSSIIPENKEYLFKYHTSYITDIGMIEKKMPMNKYCFAIIPDESMLFAKKFKSMDDAVGFWNENKNKILNFKKYFEIDTNSVRVKKVYIKDEYLLQNVITEEDNG